MCVVGKPHYVVSHVREFYDGLHRLHRLTKNDIPSTTVPATLQLVGCIQ